MMTSSQVREGGACTEVNENVNVLGGKSHYFVKLLIQVQSKQSQTQPCCKSTSYNSGCTHLAACTHGRFALESRYPGRLMQLQQSPACMIVPPSFSACQHLPGGTSPWYSVPTPCFPLPIAGGLFLPGEWYESIGGQLARGLKHS